MSNAKYIGLARDTGGSVEDLAHIQQSVSDILRTPVGSRVMRRDYGSLLSELTDRPQNAALRLQIRRPVTARSSSGSRASASPVSPLKRRSTGKRWLNSPASAKTRPPPSP